MRLRTLCMVAAAGILTACTPGTNATLPGTPSSTSTQPATSASAYAGRRKGKLVLHIKIPKRRRHHRRRGAKYVSPATAGMTIAFAGPTSIVKTIGLTPTSPNCTPVGNGATACTISIVLAPCPTASNCYSGAIVTYDQIDCVGNGSTCYVPPGANALSANQDIAFSIAPGRSNTIALILDGIPTSVALLPLPPSMLSGSSPGNAFTISKCATTAQNVEVVGLDADGNQIVGSGAPTSPTLSSNSTALTVVSPASSSSSGPFQLVPPATLTSATIPNANTVVQLTAGITPLSDSGTSAVSSSVNVTFNGDVCGVISEYSIPTTSSDPYGITEGGNEMVWFTENSGSKIGRISTNGTIAEFATTTASSGPEGIAAASDGALWFAENSANKIGRSETVGRITNEYALASGNGPMGIVPGPSGVTLWFTDNASDKIGVIETNGTVLARFSVTTSSSAPAGIASGPNGAMWFTEQSGNNIAQITTSGAVTEYPVPTSASQPVGIIAGPDGNLWFTESAGNNIGQITTSGTITEFPIPTALSAPNGIAVGRDGALWFAESGGGKIGRITTAGAISEFTAPAGSVPNGITTGPDGALWFTDSGLNGIGRVQ